MNENEPIGGEYQDKRKNFSPIPDFATESFFEDLPELRTLTRPQLEIIMSMAAVLHLLLSMPNPHGVKLPMEIAARLIEQACLIYSLKQGNDKRHTARLVLQILDWLKDKNWTLACRHDGKTHHGDSIFTDAQLRYIYVGDGPTN